MNEALAQLHASAIWRPLATMHGHGTLQCCLVPFDHARFDASLFAASGIAMPATVAASVAKRQAEFFHGRYAARLAMERLSAAADGLHIAPAAEIRIGPAREPVWPAAVTGSISHNRQMAAAVAVGRASVGGVGIDIENVVDGEAQQALLATAVSATELAHLRELAGELSLPVLVTLLFSAKESLYKGAYATVGRYFDFSAAQLTGFDAGRRQLSLTLLEELAGPFTQGSVWTVHFDLLGPDTLLTSFIW